VPMFSAPGHISHMAFPQSSQSARVDHSRESQVVQQVVVWGDVLM